MKYKKKGATLHLRRDTPSVDVIEAKTLRQHASDMQMGVATRARVCFGIRRRISVAGVACACC